MLDPAAGLGAGLVALCFPGGQRLAAKAFAVDLAAVAFGFQCLFGGLCRYALSAHTERLVLPVSSNSFKRLTSSTLVSVTAYFLTSLWALSTLRWFL
jgi:hypothetical protein